MQRRDCCNKGGQLTDWLSHRALADAVHERDDESAPNYGDKANGKQAVAKEQQRLAQRKEIQRRVNVGFAQEHLSDTQPPGEDAGGLVPPHFLRVEPI